MQSDKLEKMICDKSPFTAKITRAEMIMDVSQFWSKSNSKW